MPPHSTGSLCPKEAENTTGRIYRFVLQVLPVTLTVIAGPFIAVVYRVTQPMEAEAGSFSFAQAIRGLLCALMLLSLFFSGGLRLLKHRFVRPLLFLAAYAVLTSVVGPYPYQHIVFAVKMVFVIAIFGSALQLAEKELVSERWLTTSAWVVLFAVATCIGIGLITGRTHGSYKSYYATAGLMNHVGVTASFVLSTLPVFIRCVAVGRSALAGVVILYASLFFTMRRSALIAAAVATCCSFLINLNPLGGQVPWRRTVVLVGILLLLAGIGLHTPAGADLRERFRDLNPQGGTGAGRYIFWKISLEHVTHRPMHSQLWGEGMGSIRDLLSQRCGRAIGSHNDGLDLVNAFGVWGLIGIGWWYFELARLAWSLRDHRDGLFQGGCAAVIALGLISIGTGGSFEPPWALSYAALGFWAGRTAYAQQHYRAGNDRTPVQEQ